MTSQTIFQLDNLSKYFGQKLALSSLSLSIKKDESIALIGPSGSGKTTLLNILAHIIKPDSGQLLIDGLPSNHFNNRKDLAHKVGVIRQQFDLIDPLPVLHNVLAGRLGEWSFVKSLLSLVFPQDKDLAIQALKRVGLLDKLYEKTANLSGGEQQRVALARLLLQQPEVILADEPVASLDPTRAQSILKMLVDLAKEENKTLITSLHSVEDAKKYFTRIIALKEGEIFFDLPVDAVTDTALTDLYTLKEMP